MDTPLLPVRSSSTKHSPVLLSVRIQPKDVALYYMSTFPQLKITVCETSSKGNPVFSTNDIALYPSIRIAMYLPLRG